MVYDEGVSVCITCCCCLVAKSCPTLFVTPLTIACQAPLSMGILQARILEWVASSSSRRSSQPRDITHVSCIGRQILYHWATRAALCMICRHNREEVGIKFVGWEGRKIWLKNLQSNILKKVVALDIVDLFITETFFSFLGITITWFLWFYWYSQYSPFLSLSLNHKCYCLILYGLKACVSPKLVCWNYTHTPTLLRWWY